MPKNKIEKGKGTKKEDLKVVSKKSSNKSSKLVPTVNKKSSAKKASKTSTAKSKTKKVVKSTGKKATNKKSKTVAKSKINKSTIKDNKANIEVVEYYDLPYRYNQTVVKVLYQTPNILFIYWDISDDDRKNFIEKYGESFFYDTKPVLVVHNDTLHYSFEIEIDDFANSWYLHVNDSNCKYNVELGRKPIYHNNTKKIDIPNDYLYITHSNEIEAPNDHVLFDKNSDTIYFKDVKTNIITKKSITSLSFMRNMGKIYSLYDLHTDFNKNDWINSNHWQLDVNNPSSGTSSSSFK